MAIGHNFRKMVAKSMRPGLKSALGYKFYNSRPVFYVSGKKTYQKSPIMTLDLQNQKIAA
jgi:hypothetical protein